jgi:hypothetical protein
VIADALVYKALRYYIKVLCGATKALRYYIKVLY